MSRITILTAIIFIIVHASGNILTVQIRNPLNLTCSGVLISERWLATAATCVASMVPNRHIMRYPRQAIYSDFNITLIVEHDVELFNISINPYFDIETYENNIATVQLKYPVQFGSSVMPAELPRYRDDDPTGGEIATVTGFLDSKSTEPSATSVRILSQEECMSIMPGYVPVSDNTICARHIDTQSASCSTNVGSPLVINRMLIGVLSHAYGCKTTSLPGLYTRISSYLPWISETTGISYT